jgi:F-type H+-transporting ATPase subunit delta
VIQMRDAEPTFATIVADPGVSAQRRGELVERVFGDGRVSPLMRNFLRVLNEKGRLNVLRQIRVVYDRLRDEQLGNIDVDVTVARPLSDEQLETVRQRVGTALGRNAVVRQHVDDSIIGGLIVRVQDRLIDASVRQQLQNMKQQLLAARPKK